MPRSATLSPEERIARIDDRQRIWRETHSEYTREHNLIYNAMDHAKERARIWAQQNKERINGRRRQQYKAKREMATTAPAEA